MTATISTPVAAPKRPRHVVAWTAGAVGVAIAVLIAVLASSGQASSVATRSPLIGKPAPTLSGSLFSGGSVNLNQLSGHWVLVNFAASWCIPCQEELPQLVRLSAWGATRSSEVLTVEYSPGDGPSLQKLVDTKGASWDVVNDDQAAVSWGVGGIPESYLVDPEGTVVAKYTGGVGPAQLTELESLITDFSVPGAGAPAAPAAG